MEPKSQDKDKDKDLLQSINPPKLQDAGLEDCALPLHSIHQAFLIAADAVVSRSDADADAAAAADSSINSAAPAVTATGGGVDVVSDLKIKETDCDRNER